MGELDYLYHGARKYTANPITLLKYPVGLLGDIIMVPASFCCCFFRLLIMAHLLVNRDVDDSVSVLASKSKAVVNREGRHISFKWPGKGVYIRTILASLGEYYSC